LVEEEQEMKKIFVALLALFLLQTSVHAADKIRISTPADAAHFTMHLAQKKGFLKEEGFDAELIVISGPVANVALSNGDTDYFSGFGSAPRDSSGLAASDRCLLSADTSLCIAEPA
jgi:ABC-type nitrate/sulfonate/bicarbonate transport system substrate-binding protein